MHKNLDNVEKESDKRNRMVLSDDKESAERDEISKDSEETLTEVDKEYDEIYQIGESKEDDLESEKEETYERYQNKDPQLIKRVDKQKNRENDDRVDTDIELKTNVMKNTELSTSNSVARQLT